MWQLIGLSIIQSIMLSFGQLTLKLALEKMPAFSWTTHFWGDLLTIGGSCFVVSFLGVPQYSGCIS